MIKRPNSLSDLSTLANQVPALPPVFDYSKGQTSNNVYFPENYLCFTRNQKQLLADQETYKQHHRHVLIISLKGQGHVGIDAKLLNLQPGSVALICPFQSHSYPILSTETELLFITFDLHEGDFLHSDSSNFLSSLSNDGILAVGKFLEHWIKQDNGPHCSLWLSLILTEFQKEENHAPEQPADYRLILIQKIGEYIQSNISSPFQIDDIAQSVGLSSSRLQHAFRELIGKPLGLHIRQLRLRRACGLLHITNKPIAQIAELCGFDSIYSLSRAFKREYGLSPSNYRISSQAQLSKNQITE